MANHPQSPRLLTPHCYNLRPRLRPMASPSSVSTGSQSRFFVSPSSKASTQLPRSIKKWRKSDLTDECTKRGLSTEGTRANLISRISADKGISTTRATVELTAPITHARESRDRQLTAEITCGTVLKNFETPPKTVSKRHREDLSIKKTKQSLLTEATRSNIIARINT